MALHTQLPIHKTGSELLGLVARIHAQMPRGYKRTVGESGRFAAPLALGYNSPTSSKKGLVGLGSLKRYRGMKPQRHHSLAALSICAPFLAAQMGGAQAPAGFAPRFASLPTRLSRRLCWEADATVVLTNQLEHFMANALTPFNFGQFAIRTTTVGDAVWFSAADVCDVLGIKNHRDSLQHIDEDEKGVVSSDTLGGQQKISVVNESGLYALVLRSRKPEARKFAKWVTSEVLPAIRKTGSYSVAPVQKAPSLLNRRVLVSLDHHGKEQLQFVPNNACVAAPEEWAKMIREAGGLFLEPQTLADIASACTERLARQAASYMQSTQALRLELQNQKMAQPKVVAGSKVQS
jgi:prophage antirepressor-like protein